MDLTLWIVVGALGMWLIEASYLPQIVRLFRRKEAGDVSVFFPGLNLTGRLLAVAYSVHAGTLVLAFGFFFGVLVRLTFLSQVVYYRYLRDQGDTALSVVSVEEYEEPAVDTVLARAA